MGVFSLARGTAARFLPSTDAASLRNSLRPAPRRSPASHAVQRANSSSAPQIPERFFLLVPSTSLRGPTNRDLSTRSFFHSGDAWIGGALLPRLPTSLPANLLHHPACRAWNFLCAPATPRTPARNGPAGSVPTPNPEAAQSVRRPVSCSGKPSFM